MKNKGMKKQSLFTICCAMTFIATNLLAADWGDRWRYDAAETDKFKAPDFSVDLFGTAAERDRFGDDTWHGGGGLGLNYFPHRFIGIGADSYIEEWKAPYRANGSLILRLPLGQTGLAPYALGGGGRQWKYVPQWTWHAGGGLELKLNPYTGLFADGRRVFPEDTEDYTLLRAGLRVGF